MVVFISTPTWKEIRICYSYPFIVFISVMLSPKMIINILLIPQIHALVDHPIILPDLDVFGHVSLGLTSLIQVRFHN